MKIDPSQISAKIGAYKTQKSIHPLKKTDAAEPDKVLLSGKAQVFQMALKAVHESADIRTVKIQNISDAVANGQYSINARKAADSIVEAALISNKR